jgi:hypothetical protein
MILIPPTSKNNETLIKKTTNFRYRSEVDVYLTGTDAIITHPHQTEIFAIMK